MNRPAILVFFIITILISSCEFVPDEIEETIVEHAPFAPPIEFSLNDYNDTIVIGWLTDFRYNINSNNKVFSVKIIFCEKTLVHNVAGSYQSVNFSINASLYNNGTYPLHVEIVTGSGSGSIADKLDAEGLVYELDWPVKIDKTLPYSSSCVLKATHSKKAIELSWAAFDHPNFRSYSIYRTINALVSPVQIAVITDPFITSFSDTTYWEGERNYYHLRINSPAGYAYGNEVAVNDTLTGIEAEWCKDGTVKVRWDKVENIESFGGYYVYSYFDETSVLEKHFINDPDQNYLTLSNSGFAYGLYIRLKFIPKNLNENRYPYVTGKVIRHFPEPVLPKHTRAYSVNGRDYILLATTNRLYRYHPNEMNVSDSVLTRLPREDMLAVSNDGQLFSYTDFTNIFVRRSGDFMIVRQFPSPTLIKPKQWDPNYENLAFFSLADNGRLAVCDFDGIIHLYDGFSGSLINKDTILIDGKAISNGILSPDGSRLIAYSGSVIACLELDGDRWKEISRIPSFLNPVLFWSADGMSLYLAGNEKIERRLSDLTLISAFAKSSSYAEGADAENGKILYEKYNTQSIYDLNTGQVLRTLQLGNAGINLPSGNILINTNGLQITLPE
jgi:WD40 repeat protein